MVDYNKLYVLLYKNIANNYRHVSKDCIEHLMDIKIDVKTYNSTGKLGSYRSGINTIYLADWVVEVGSELNDWGEVEKVIRHELSHAYIKHIYGTAKDGSIRFEKELLRVNAPCSKKVPVEIRRKNRVEFMYKKRRCGKVEKKGVVLKNFEYGR